VTTTERLPVGLWGTFDVENYGDHLFPRVAAHELGRRLAGVEVRAYSPLGWLHPTRMDGGEPAEALGPWGPSRRVELAAELRCVIIGGGEIIHTRDELLAPAYDTTADEMRRLAPSRWFIEGLGPELERTCPVVWHAVGVPFDLTGDEAAQLRVALAGRPYISVRDERSRTRLLDAGVDAEIAVVPDSALLVRRVLPDSLLEKRRAYLRAMGWYPPDGTVVVLQGNRDLLPHVDAIADACARVQREHPDLRAVLAQTGMCHGDAEFADRLAVVLSATLPTPPFRLPPEAGVDDVAAAVSGARTFVGSSLHGSITALAYGASFVSLDFTAASKLGGFAGLVGSTCHTVDDPSDVHRAWADAMTGAPRPAVLAGLQGRVDAHFDRIAEIVATAGPPFDGEADLAAARSAHAALERRVRAERLRLADHVQEWQEERTRSATALAEAQAAIEAQRQRADVEKQRADALDRELAALRATKTFRYLEPVRRAYGRLRRHNR
jgi:polysaccharide pyruvyl transferase WcaK-like protein